MKIIAENPETKEQFEAEVVDLKPDDLKQLETFHFPENKNPETVVRRYIENQDISADEKARYWEKLRVFAQAALRVGNRVLSIGRKVFDFVLHLVKSYPNTAIGLAFGAALAALVSAIPVLGFLFGGLAKVILPLIGGILGFRGDLADKAFKRRVFEAINDPSVENAIEKEVRSYEPLKTPPQTSAEGASADSAHAPDCWPPCCAGTLRSVLADQTEVKFGKEAAAKLEKLLAATDNLERLSNVARHVITCASSDELLKKSRLSLN